MKRFSKNVIAFRIGDWPVNYLDQEMLRSLSRIADGRGWYNRGDNYLHSARVRRRMRTRREDYQISATLTRVHA